MATWTSTVQHDRSTSSLDLRDTWHPPGPQSRYSLRYHLRTFPVIGRQHHPRTAACHPGSTGQARQPQFRLPRDTTPAWHRL
jgi:hypothetical protein